MFQVLSLKDYPLNLLSRHHRLSKSARLASFRGRVKLKRNDVSRFDQTSLADWPVQYSFSLYLLVGGKVHRDA